MLAQLEKLPGVETAMANRDGSLVRVRVTEASLADEIASEISEIFAARGRAPKRLPGASVIKTIEGEEWRDSNTIGELSLIEARTLFLKRIAQFIDVSELDAKTAARLKNLSRTVLVELPIGGDNRPKPEPPHGW